MAHGTHHRGAEGACQEGEREEEHSTEYEGLVIVTLHQGLDGKPLDERRQSTLHVRNAPGKHNACPRLA